jgi:hypothetical protein
MSRRSALLLRASVIWTAWVWIVLIRNMIDGQNMSTTYRLTQIVLGIVSIAFAVVTWQITSTARRFTRGVERERRPAVERKSVAHRAGASVRRRTRGSDAATLPEVSTTFSIPVPGSIDSPD